MHLIVEVREKNQDFLCKSSNSIRCTVGVYINNRKRFFKLEIGYLTICYRLSAMLYLHCNHRLGELSVLRRI